MRQDDDPQRIDASAPILYCEGCGGSSLLRSDSGLCERCTAKRPEAREKWSEWRRRCERRAKGIDDSKPITGCLVCGSPYGANITDYQHKQVCKARPIACSYCPRRFDRDHDRRKHEERCHPAGTATR